MSDVSDDFSDDFDERLVAGGARLEQEAAVGSPLGVRARGDQRRRRHTATMAVVPVAVLAIAGTVGLTLRPSGGSSRHDVAGSPSVSSVQSSAVGGPASSSASAPQSSPAATGIPTVTVDLADHTMAVLDKQGKLVKTLRMSAGSPAHPTQVGTFTVVGKMPSKTISSATAGSTDVYSVSVSSFIDLGSNAPAVYAAPWQLSVLGTANVSHGDIDLAPDDAAWLYNRLAVGDVIQVAAGAAG